ncbi:hypothetical protein [Marinobacterium nitratireducens]|nr:hypothetical protein [Marinobacterium nitratireducens]
MEHDETPDTGYIKLFRTLQECAFAHRPEFMSTWVHILLMASHKPHKTMLGNQSVVLQAGQFISGRKALAQIVGTTEKTMRGILDYFVDEGMLTKTSSRAGTVFTVCKYSEFQEKRGQAGPTVSGQAEGQAEGQGNPSNGAASSNIGAKESANNGATKGPSKRATIQEDKVKTKSKEKSNARERAPRVKFDAESFNRFWSAYPNKTSKGQAEITFSKLNPDETLTNKILTALEAQVAHRAEAKAAGQWMPQWKNPSTWLNGKCWDDELQPIETPQPNRRPTPSFDQVDYYSGAEGFDHV